MLLSASLSALFLSQGPVLSHGERQVPATGLTVVAERSFAAMLTLDPSLPEVVEETSPTATFVIQ